MTPLLDDQLLALDVLLPQIAQVQQRGPGRWDLSINSDAAQQVEIRQRHEWISLAARLRNPPAEPFWLLERQGAQAGPARFARSPMTGDWSVRADVVVEPERNPARRMVAALRSLGSLVGVELNIHDDVGVHAEPSDSLKAELQPSNLEELCTAAGWHGTARASGAVAVPLDDRDGLQALVDRDGDGLQATLSLLKVKRLSDESKSALGQFLCEAADRVRLARPAAVASENNSEVRLEINLGPACTPFELDTALGAMLVAGRLCAREARALADEAIAKEYLAVRGPSSSQEHRHP